LFAEVAAYLSIALHIVNDQRQKHTTRLEEAVDLHASAEPEQAAGLAGGELAGAHAFNRKRLQGRARESLRIAGQVMGDVLGQFESELHEGFHCYYRASARGESMPGRAD
jgi:hypothetical protein